MNNNKKNCVWPQTDLFNLGHWMSLISWLKGIRVRPRHTCGSVKFGLTAGDPHWGKDKACGKALLLINIQSKPQAPPTQALWHLVCHWPKLPVHHIYSFPKSATLHSEPGLLRTQIRKNVWQNNLTFCEIFFRGYLRGFLSLLCLYS